MERKAKPAPIARDWVAKSLAGLLLGLGLALAASGLYNQVTLATPLPVRGQLAMWLVPPVWFGTLAGVFFFQNGLRAWLWLGALNLLAWGALLALRAPA